MRFTAKFLSVCHWSISDKAAGAIAKRFTNSGKLPRVGMETPLLPAPGIGEAVVLARTPCRHSDLPQKKRGWAWCIYGDVSHKADAGASFSFTI